MCRLLELMIFNVYRAERRNELQYWPRRVDNKLRAANVTSSRRLKIVARKSCNVVRVDGSILRLAMRRPPATITSGLLLPIWARWLAKFRFGYQIPTFVIPRLGNPLELCPSFPPFPAITSVVRVS